MLYPELIDPDTGAPLALTDGAEGELVLTHLERECQPLVRFRTGDIIAVDETGACRCGRTGIRFRVIGRSDDMVVVRGLNLFPTMVAAVISRVRSSCRGDYRIVLDTRPPYDVSAGRGGTGARDPGRREGIAAADREGDQARSSAPPRGSPCCRPGSLPVTEGKTQRV